MDHEAAKDLFSDYLDGELPPEELAELEAHLAHCASCREELEEFRNTLSSLAGLAQVEVPPEFVTKVQQRIRTRSRGRFFSPENLLTRIPFEWISFFLIMLMLALYFMAMPTVKKAATAADAGPAKEIHQPPAHRDAEPKVEQGDVR